MKREETQRRSAEKQHRILDCLKKAGKPMSIKAVQEEGTRRSTKVSDTRYPHICLFDNGHAYPWADVIRCHRRGGRTLGEWER